MVARQPSSKQGTSYYLKFVVASRVSRREGRSSAAVLFPFVTAPFSDRPAFGLGCMSHERYEPARTEVAAPLAK